MTIIHYREYIIPSLDNKNNNQPVAILTESMMAK